MRRALISSFLVAVVAFACAAAYAQTVESLEREITSMVARLSKSLVAVSAVAERGGRPVSRSVGCGVVFDRDGRILTTASVVGYSKQVDVVTDDGTSYKGAVVGTDPASDLAVIKIDGAGLRPVTFSRERTLKPGSWIFVLGNAFGSLPSVSMGVVSGLASPVKDDTGQDLLRISIPINPGDTGGPVVNARGDVVGIAVGRISFNPMSLPAYAPGTLPLGVGIPQASNMSVAVPAERALEIANEIVRTGGRQRGFLGVRVVELTDDMRSHMADRTIKGVVVTDVVPASPAESVGIAPGDVITGLGPGRVQSVRSLLETVGETKPGDVLQISYFRDSRLITSRVRVTPFRAEYLHQQAAAKTNPEDVEARIQNIRSEIQRLEADLKQLESGR